MPSTPGGSGPSLAFLGNQTSAAACAAAAQSNASYTSWTWVSGGDNIWNLGCYARTDGPSGACVPNVGVPQCSAPCFSSAETGIYSAVSKPLDVSVSTWTREFEHLSVSYTSLTGVAIITQK